MFTTKTFEGAEAVARHCGGRAVAIARINGEWSEVDDSIAPEAFAIKLQGAFVDMTQAIWSRLNDLERSRARDYSGLTRQLLNLEGWRVEVEGHDGEVRRFLVGRSAGWRPCHLELRDIRAASGASALPSYRRVTPLRRQR